MPVDIMAKLGHGGSFHRTIVTVVPQALSLALAVMLVGKGCQSGPTRPVFENGVQKYTPLGRPMGQKRTDPPKSPKK